MRAHRQDIQWGEVPDKGTKHIEWLTVVTVCAEDARNRSCSTVRGLQLWKTRGVVRFGRQSELFCWAGTKKILPGNMSFIVTEIQTVLEADQIKGMVSLDTINIARVFFSLQHQVVYSLVVFLFFCLHTSVCFLSHVWDEWHFPQIQICIAFNNRGVKSVCIKTKLLLLLLLFFAKSRHPMCWWDQTFLCPLYFNFLYKDNTTIQSCNVVWVGVRREGGGWVCLLCSPSIYTFFFSFRSVFLRALHLLANLVAQDLVPVDLGARHRKLAA